MSSAVAPLRAMTEQTTSPTAATTSSGSSRRCHSRGTSGGGGSEAGLIGVAVLTRRGERSGRKGGDRGSSVGAGALDELLVRDVEPLRQDEPRGGGRGGPRAAGAAVSAPKPPRSIVTATRIGRVLCGTYATYHDWSGWPGRSTVPV